MTVEELIDRYCRCWTDLEPMERRRQLAGVVTDDIAYVDPTVDVQGVDAFAGHIGRVLADYPGAVVQRTTMIDRHHRMARFGWHLVTANGVALPEGLDIIRLNESDTRIEHVLGFFGPLRPE